MLLELGEIVWSISIYLVSTTFSVFLYRVSPFHPLAAYSGPVIARITKFWGVWNSWGGDQHHVLYRLHQQYGPFIRVGPNELSMADVQAVTAVFGAGGLPKGEWYSARSDPNAPKNLIVLTGEEHANRRRLWNRGMSKESLRNYEATIGARAHELVRYLTRIMSSGSVDIGRAFGFFTFDFMGDMAFGGPFHMLRDGSDTNKLWEALEHFAVSASLISHIPWASGTVSMIPLLSSNLKRLRKFGVDSAMSRVKAGSTKKDLWYHLSDEAEMEKSRPPLSNVAADGTLAVIAGADTTAGALTSLFYFLLSNRDCYKRLQREIDAVYPTGTDPMDMALHDQLTWLDACLNETLRLQPPVPTNGPRQVPRASTGAMIAGRFVPPGTQVYVPPYSLHRDPRYFSPNPERFLPSRWLLSGSGESGVLEPTAFIPFSYGPANCVGRHLARMEMKMVVSLLLKTFEFEFAEGFDSEQWPSTIKDYLVTAKGPLLVKIRERDGTGTAREHGSS